MNVVFYIYSFSLGCVLGFVPGGKTAIIITERINIYMFDVYKFLQREDNDNAGKRIINDDILASSSRNQSLEEFFLELN